MSDRLEQTNVSIDAGEAPSDATGCANPIATRTEIAVGVSTAPATADEKAGAMTGTEFRSASASEIAPAPPCVTLLCYEMNGSPLMEEHGAPLRLVIPVKYGVKNIKRLGTIRYSTLRPANYWAERGYDWYVGL